MNLLTGLKSLIHRIAPGAPPADLGTLRAQLAAMVRSINALKEELADALGAKLGAEEAAATLRGQLAVKDKEICRLADLIAEKDEEIGRLDALLVAAQLEIEDVRAENIRLKGGEQLPLAGVDSEGSENVVPLPDEVISDVTHEMAMEIVRLSFRDGNVWHFTQGDEELSAKIEDERFLERLHARELAFADGDIVRARVRNVSRRTGAGIKTERRILEVLEVTPPPRQLEIAGGVR